MMSSAAPVNSSLSSSKFFSRSKITKNPKNRVVLNGSCNGEKNQTGEGLKEREDTRRDTEHAQAKAEEFDIPSLRTGLVSHC